MTTRRRLGIVAAALALTTLGGLALVRTGPVTAQNPANAVAPRFQVDPWWPKPLPNNWLMGQAAGVAVDVMTTCGSSSAPARSPRTSAAPP